jgi:hypothetical protein
VQRLVQGGAERGMFSSPTNFLPCVKGVAPSLSHLISHHKGKGARED